MANISSANGTCRIITSSKENCYKIFNILAHAGNERWEYSTYYSEKDESVLELLDNKYQFEVYFDGYGRWCYLNNIENTFHWLKDYLTKDEWLFLTNTDFEIQYEYTDYEGGMLYLIDETVRLIHNAGQEPTDSEVVEDSHDEYPFTPLWLTVKVFGKIDEALDCEFNWYELEEEDKERLFNGTICDYIAYYGLTNKEAEEKVLEDSKLFGKFKGGVHQCCLQI